MSRQHRSLRDRWRGWRSPSLGAAIAAGGLALFAAIGPVRAEGTGDGGALGDMGGLRPALEAHGVSLDLSETSEVFGNLTGGFRRGVRYDGLTTMSLAIDSEKALGWRGGSFHISAFQIHGRSISADNLGVLQTLSNIEAGRTTRLWELWVRQQFAGGKADLKLGQQSLDQEFIVSEYAGLFLNAAFGWPALPSLDLYAGGPAYPLSSLGIRLRVHPSEPVTLLAGVFDDNPPGGPFDDDSQLRGAEAAGTAFHLGTGALLIAEVQYTSEAGLIFSLPGTYKLGAWFDTARFPDRRFDSAGVSLADPASSGVPRQHRGNFSLYGVIDQTVWRAGGDDPRALGVFFAAMGGPGDRNLIDFSIRAGIDLKAPLPGRAQDSFGIGYGLAGISGRAAALDRDVRAFAAAPIPVRSAEQLIEVTYRFELLPWWELQPDFQYIFDPGGGIAAPDNPGRRVGDEAILGLRTRISF